MEVKCSGKQNYFNCLPNCITIYISLLFQLQELQMVLDSNSRPLHWWSSRRMDLRDHRRIPDSSPRRVPDRCLRPRTSRSQDQERNRKTGGNLIIVTLVMTNITTKIYFSISTFRLIVMCLYYCFTIQ